MHYDTTRSDATSVAVAAAPVDGSPARPGGAEDGVGRRPFLRRALAGAAMVALGTGGVLVGAGATTSHAQTGPYTPSTPVPPPGQFTPGTFVNLGPGLGGLPGLELLQGVDPAQRFAHLLGSQTTVLDASGNRVTYVALAGKVTSVSATSLTIQANDTQLGAVTYTVNADTKLQKPTFTVQTLPQTGQSQGGQFQGGPPNFPGGMAGLPGGSGGFPGGPGGQGGFPGGPNGQGSGGQTPFMAPPGQGQGQGQGQTQGQPPAPPQAPQLSTASITDLHAGDQVIVTADTANPILAKAVVNVPTQG